jgi:putative acetyltransferase
VPEHQRHTLEDARTFFRQGILGKCRVWVAVREETMLGLLALEAPWIRTLAVFPEFQRQGVGTALLRAARAASPDDIRLFTFQRNTAGRAFYDHHGFVAVAFGLSPPPEEEPDVEYRWPA